MAAASSTSLSSRSRRHHIVSKPSRSRVDETLFGPPAHLKMMSGNRTWTASTETAWNQQTEREPKQQPVVEVITKDLIRKLKIPGDRDPSGMSTILDLKQYSRIKSCSKVLSPAEQKKLAALKKQDKQKRIDECNARKSVMKDLEMQRKQNTKPNDLEQEALDKGSQLVANAKVKLDEQDDEIKQINEYILNAKCHAIRDAQLQEMQEIQKLEKDEEQRLDLMMEVERLRALQEYEEREQRAYLQRLKGAKMIHQQIEEREVQRRLEAEKKDQETQQMLKYMERLQQEDWEQLKNKHERQLQLKEEVNKCNEEIKQQKLEQREQEKLQELKIVEYLKEKQAREEEHQKEQERLKMEKELEVAQLRAQQEKAKDKQAERDALRAKRNQEQFERDWRRKERENAIKKAETERNLCIAREEQVRDKEHFAAVQAQRDRTEFDRVLKAQQDKIAADELSQKRAESRRKKHITEVRKQIHEKEEELIAARRAYFEEGIKLDQEAKERRRRLDDIKQQKLNELRLAGIPDKYCAEVSRKITGPPPSITS